MSSNYSLAQQISTQLNSKWGVTWITPLLVQVFMVFTLPVRRFVTVIIRQNIATLQVKKQKYVLDSLKGNSLAQSIENLRVATEIVLEPVNQFLQVLPLDTILKEIPSFSNFTQSTTTSIKDTVTTSTDNSLNSLSKISPELSSIISDILNFIPVKIPLQALSSTLGLNAFDFFDGINSFADLQEKVEDLEFRLARATALSTYANAGSSFIDNLLKKANIYIDIIETLDTNGV
jgi:hypothetical protein